MDQNFNNGFDNQNTGNDGYNNSPYSNPYDQSQQNYYNSYEQSTQQTQQNYAQQYQQTYGQPQHDDNQYNHYDQSYNQPYQQPYNQAYGQQYGSMYQEDKSIKRFAIASLVLGIVSFFCCGIITSILAIVFGRISLNKQPLNNGLAKAGFILGIIGLVGSILGTILMNCTGTIDSAFSEYMCHLFM